MGGLLHESESRIAIGLVILGGLAFSSLLIVMVIPLLYTLLAPLTARKGQASEAVDKALGGQESA